MKNNLKSLKLFHQGKVRDTYIANDNYFLMITSDRISAFDVIMNQNIPDKGKVLTNISNFWFDKTSSIICNHLTTIKPESFVNSDEYELIHGRSVVVKRLKSLKVEAIVRGYLIGSAWKDYCSSGEVSGIRLKRGLKLGQQLDEPIFTPSTKANVGDHDENISFKQMQNEIGADLAYRIRDISLDIYKLANSYALTKDIIIADTKFEYGLDIEGNLTLMDEILTPDSSRFWDMKNYKVGESPKSFDKQYLRDWLELSGWDKKSIPPDLPENIIKQTIEKYKYVQKLLMQKV
jgi:phosphoribosylaminoimidazole-succinocarboxamide synthase